MPELPEVEVVRRGLLPRVHGRVIERVEVLDPRAVRRQHGGPESLAADLVGARITAVARRGKFLWWRLAEGPGTDDVALMTHLGMSGQLRVRDRAGAREVELPAPAEPPGEGPAPDPRRHRRLTLTLDDGTEVDFLDQRLFGGMWTSALAPSADGRLAAAGSPDTLLPVDAAHIARDVLDPAVDLAAVARRLRARSAAVKSLLLAQDLISGIGNIYADEALWAARTHYATPGEALSQVRAHRLLQETRQVMERALEVGGTSFDALYVNVEGRSGFFARSLAAYGKEGEPCPRCGTPIRRAVHQGRSSFFCPHCQRRRQLAARPITTSR
ncbi:bifunctional DNA-formamidopyrimidine glycosylase/DNA-(apurinic or apyrimidinic site) lyase [Brachybacterium huguangmaarense]|uniref:Formamidopyrimidine-DNA glycosylase n=1 Tax=Brachybacterium huguangmaarense TaxID=1652028 RepID=A0ABY6G097_9MICO|nr:bifunctional DNA-formamidopyrimidine glycosylase/DNA-(apurinic or apyrimidinic site) lyase [Brachybacterium huguangmaarense]UYG16099.1 bifunctional DNA-formamidopyrimidine glycosylase/DNA-(apurinic or apyrimidinic site) lyase [Brachybacterium huguangmaarense]